MKKNVFLLLMVMICGFYGFTQPPVSVPGTNIPLPPGVGIPGVGTPGDQPVDIPSSQEIDEILEGINPRNEKDKIKGAVDNDEERQKRQLGLGDGVQVQFDSIGIFGHDYLRTNNFKYYQSIEEVNVTDDYILGTGDSLTINLWASNDIRSDGFTISQDGHIQQEKWGRVYLKGVTYGKAKDILRTRYSKFYIFDYQNFEVTLTGSKLINVDIVGDVEIPGSYRVPSVNTVFNVLKRAGGPTIYGSVRNIQIKRGGQIHTVLDVYDYLTNAENKQNIYLQDNDVIYIPQIGKVVEIEGAVKKQTKYEMKENETFKDLLYFSGGFEPYALKNRIQIFRFEEDQYKLKDFQFRSDLDVGPQLFNGDVVSIKKIEPIVNNIVNVEGAVNQPGYYEYENGLRISDLLNKANGVRFDAITTKAYLTRYTEDLEATSQSVNLEKILADPNSDDNIVLYPKDNLEILSKADFATQYTVQIFGEVKKPRRFRFGNEMSLQDILIQSGGFKTNALNQQIELHRVIGYSKEDGRRIPIRDVFKVIDIDYDFINSPEADSIKLEPFDHVFVRSVPDFYIPQTVQINGEVEYPGHYPLENKGMKLSDLIERSGGLSPFAYRTGARFYRDELVQREKVEEVEETIRVRDFTDTIGITFYDSIVLVPKVVKFDTIVKEIVVVDLNDVLSNKNSDYNYVLKPNDLLVIPPVDEVVSIKGAIRNEVNDTTIINTAFVGERNAKWYVNNYGGGFDKGAWKRYTQVLLPNGQAIGTKKVLFFNDYPEVKPGSDILIEYKPKRDPEETFFGDLNASQTLTFIGSLVTTTALILALSNRN